jgi:LuxR family maltose regulon positive regulatory protein
MSVSLLATKTFRPLPQERLVTRSRLIERLDSAIRERQRQLLVSAPAGCGKTTLLAEWAGGIGAPLAWLSLDQEDNDPARFWAYLMAAVQTRYPGAGQSLLEELLASQPPPIPAVLPEIVNGLAALPGSLVLVLDDYHVIETPAIHENLLFLIEHIPPGFQLVVATRSDPPLALFRLRARGQLAELRSADLRFTGAETAAFLNDCMGLSLGPRLIDQLEKRTEGWAVGLQLAGLSMQGREDPAAFIERFSGSHHFILEYLTGEVLAQQPAAIQEFLLETSILESFNAPLCRAVTGQEDSEAVLETLRKANLFLVPLDDEACWFRYHHLFSELLRLRLAQRGVEEISLLHRRAAAWYGDRQMIDESIGHSLSGQDSAAAVILVARNWRQAVHDGRLKSALRWIEALPPEVLSANPLHASAYAWVLWLLGQTDRVESYVELTEKGYAALEAAGEIPPGNSEYTSLPGQMAALRAMIAGRRFDLLAAARFAEEAIRLSPPTEQLALGLARIAYANSHREMGHIRRAVAAYEEAIPTAQASGNTIATAIAAFNLGRLYQVQGRPDLCEALHRRLLDQAEREGQSRLPAYGLMWIGLADLEYEHNHLSESETALSRGLDQGKRGGYLDLLKNAGILQARLARAHGDLPRAAALLEETLAIVLQSQTVNATAEAAAWLACFQAELGNHEAAARWVDSLSGRVEASPGFTRGIEAFHQVRVLIALGRLEPAWRLAKDLENVSAGEMSLGRQAEALLLQAKILSLQDAPSKAVDCLCAGLALTQTQGLVRRIVDEGDEIRGLLAGPRLTFPSSPEFEEYRARLLAAFPVQTTRIDPAPRDQAGPAGTPGLSFPLSERELEVLRLMAKGLSNPQIAAILVVSPGTVKTHVSHIYDKLGSQNRAEAVSQAITLKLI